MSVDVTTADAAPAEESASEEQTAPKGLTLYKDAYLGFSFFRPSSWYQFSWLDRRRGVLFGPIENDSSTLFAVAVQELGTRVAESDLPDLHIGFIAGIGRLTDCKVEWQDQWKHGDLIGMEARYTFKEEGIVRKRWVRVLYHDTRQITLTAQGATAAEYEQWLPLLHEQMNTFRVDATPLYKKRAAKPTAPVAGEIAEAPSTETSADSIDTETA